MNQHMQEQQIAKQIGKLKEQADTPDARQEFLARMRTELEQESSIIQHARETLNQHEPIAEALRSALSMVEETIPPPTMVMPGQGFSPSAQG